MNEVIEKEEIKIENMIYEIRGESKKSIVSEHIISKIKISRKDVIYSCSLNKN